MTAEPVPDDYLDHVERTRLRPLAIAFEHAAAAAPCRGTTMIRSTACWWPGRGSRA